jgi:CubicO group peptidase (beta-lactamase class C family)
MPIAGAPAAVAGGVWLPIDTTGAEWSINGWRGTIAVGYGFGREQQMSSAWVARHGMTSAEYQAEFDRWTGQGFRLREVSGYGVGSQDFYAAIWEKVPSPAWEAHHRMTSGQYQAKFNELVGQGFRLTNVSGYSVGGQDLYAAIWDKSSGPAWEAHHRMTSDQYQAKFNELVGKGFRLIDVSGYAVGSQDLYAAIWDRSPGSAWEAHHRMTSDQYQAKFDQLVGQGFRLKSVSGYAVGGQDLYAAIWDRSASPAWEAHHRMTSDRYQTQFDQLVDQGYRLLWVSGYGVGTTANYAALWQQDAMSDADVGLIDSRLGAYMTQQSIPGLSFAVTKDERLVFAKGYGRADTTSNEPVTPDSIFRIASISKPVTAVAVMELVESGKLHLDDTVFGTGAILGTTYGSSPYAENVKGITVRHLASHTSGWSNDGGDPMFMNLGMSQAQLIGWVLDNRPLKNDPGKAYEYLNFGFCVLGRVIERVSGLSYESYVKNAVLSRCGISRMQIGAETQTAKASHEVTYYGSSPYSLLTHRMDAHGGWIATPIDLLRMMVRVDGFTARADILSPGDETSMYTGSSVNPGYGLGWVIESADRAHNGAMDGTMGFLVRRNDGISYAVLVNTRAAVDNFAWGLKGVIDGFVGSITWPGSDLF